MDEQYIRNSLLDWMINFVEQPNSKLGNWPPCPYARKARLDNKFKILFDYSNNFADSIAYSKIVLETNDVVAICFDHKKIDADYLRDFIKNLNTLLMQEDYVILEDHPDTLEYVNGVNMNFGLCGLLLIQKLSKLNEASSQLKAKGYYDHWNQQVLDDVVNWRNN